MELTDEQTNAAVKELLVKFPKVDRLPRDPPIAMQNFGLFSFKLLPKPINNVYGFLKFRGAFATQAEWEAHAKNIIRSVDSKHHIWPYETGRWMPITTNEEFAQETLSVGQQDELNDIYNQKETAEQRKQKQMVNDIKAREQKLMSDARRKEVDNTSIDYYAQQVMKVQQLESWLEMMRKRKRDMLKALKSGRDEMKRVEVNNPEYKEQVDNKIREIKAGIGLDPDAPIDGPSFTPQN
jgi:hypothetical protein